MSKEENEWLYTINAKSKLLEFNFKEIWRYRDLLFLFVKRDVVTVYKQTILGPLWYFIQPLLTALIFTLIFNNLAKIPTGDGIPNFLFNLAGITLWNYFKECFTGTADTFKKNQQIFGKVYFPRVVMPLSITISNLVKFGIQLLIFIAFYFYYKFIVGTSATPNVLLASFPVLVITMGLLGLGLGMVVSSLTNKYRDLSFLVQFGVQLLMYASAVMYPLAHFKEKLPEYYPLIKWNPITAIIETFRNITLGVGEFSLSYLAYALSFSIVVFLIGLVIFNKTEKQFIDTV